MNFVAKSSENETISNKVLLADQSVQSDRSCCLQCRKFDSPLFKCSRCRSALYCSALCQKANWKLHKVSCKGPIISVSSSMGFDEIQRIINICAKGSVIQFDPGFYSPSVETREVDAQHGMLGLGKVRLPVSLMITKAITLIGTTTDLGTETTTHFPFGIIVDPGEKTTVQGGKLAICNVKVGADVQIKDNSFQRIELTNFQIDANATRIPEYVLRVDALDIGNCSGDGVFLDNCIIYGGWDGVNNSGNNTRLFIKDCEIRFAACRGIFSNSHFLIEDSEVTCCGSYGIKDRAGSTKRGNNDIQPGPWDEENPENAGAAGWKQMTSQLFGRRTSL